MRRYFKLFTLLISLTLLISACVGQNTNNAVMKVGFIGALTGDAASYGADSKNMIELMVQDINKDGGIHGKKLEVLYEDGKCMGKDAVSAFQKLTQVDGVKMILGGSCSGETLSMAPFAERDKVILFSPLSTSPDITDAGDFIFRTAPSDAMSGSALAEVAYNDLKYKTVSIISENTDYAQALGDVFTKHFQDLGGKVLINEKYDPSVSDFRSQLTKIKHSDSDAVYIVPQGPAAGALILRQLRELGIDLPVLTTETLGSNEGIRLLHDTINGVIFAEAYADTTSKKAQDLFERYKKQFGDTPSFPIYALYSYDAGMILGKALKEVGMDPEKMRDYLYKLKDYRGVSGVINFDKNGDVVGGFKIKTIKDGKIINLGKF